MNEFLFLRPLWLFAIIPLLLIIWLVWHKQNNQHSWKQVCDPRLLKHLIVGTETKKRNITVWLLLFYGTVSIVSLAGPAWDKLPQPVFRQQSSLVILFDLSKSMQAQDVKPSRLVRARLKLLDILNQRQEGQTALIVYAGDAFMVSPLTDDTDTIAQLVPSLIPAMMPMQGSRSDLAVSKALELFKQGGITEGEILLLTDEVPDGIASSITKILNKVNFSLSILSVGSEQGAPVNLLQGGFLKDSSGSIVIAKTNGLTLKRLAIRNNGRYSKLSVDDNDIQKILHTKLFKNNRSEESNAEHDAEIWREQGPWLVLLLLPLVLLSFRKGLVFVLVLILMPVSEPSYALSWDSLWSNSNQQAKKLFDKGKNKESAEQFQDNDWKAAANYKAGDYQKSLDLLEGKNDINSTYNRANTLAKLKKYEEAIKAYDDVIKQNPKHKDALHNKKLVEEELKKQQEQDNKGKGKDQKDNKKDGKDKGKDQKDNKNGKSGDQKNQDKNSQKQDGQDSKNKDSQNKDNELNPQDSKSKEQQEKEQQNNKSVEKNKNEQSEEKKDVKEKQKADKDSDKNKKEQQDKLSEQTKLENKEQQQAVEQWLRKIPDDPAGLMRRKFKYQYQQRNNQNNSKGPAW